MEDSTVYQACIVNAVAADDLVTQGARVSSPAALIKFSWNILAWAPEGLLLARARNKYAECERYGGLIYL